MTGSELRAIRKSRGLSSEKFGLALGYGRNAKSAGVSVRKHEMRPDKPIPDTIAILALYLDRYGLHLSRQYHLKSAEEPAQKLCPVA